MNVEYIDARFFGNYQQHAVVKSVMINAKIIVKNVNIFAAKRLLKTNGSPVFLRVISY